MEKKMVVQTVANVRIGVANPLVGDKNFVRFAIQSTGGGVSVGRKLFVFDHRPAVLQAAKAIISDASWEDRRKAEESLTEAIRQPAKVVVMEKTDGDKTFHYVNLYPANGQNPTALFSETAYTGKHNAGFSVKEDGTLWSWMSESSSRTGAHWELVLVALTDETHKVIVESSGYANIGHTDENLTVIAADIRQMAEEELVVDLEP
ncbi:MAG: hypothetical protein HY980_04450 [Candidatus Magasanikbacteria bacterium]|nr:hypothetical protein [Candidatus Magasanikbacteria bacterium]